ncbi:hypothetical protein B879_02949 [Cecembia lonarensis LW9]|uniref:Uncharacterized protein n=1 Tax=Cecembia lonarensis (strain CCUG 58316 / KCTC 22772 / LW9) TaxID=1225176 RepID=K1LWA1_CECL9|nr:hypothetical protein B879_02949 [Cecembia lonarensis LW9]
MSPQQLTFEFSEIKTPRKGIEALDFFNHLSCLIQLLPELGGPCS